LFCSIPRLVLWLKITVNLKRCYLLYDELEPSGCMLSCFGNINSTSVHGC
jgi:hypothetical protein